MRWELGANSHVYTAMHRSSKKKNEVEFSTGRACAARRFCLFPRISSLRDGPFLQDRLVASNIRGVPTSNGAAILQYWAHIRTPGRYAGIRTQVPQLRNGEPISRCTWPLSYESARRFKVIVGAVMSPSAREVRVRTPNSYAP